MKRQSLKAADELFADFIKALSETGHLVDLSAKGIYQLYSVGELIENFTSLLTAVSVEPHSL
jgi:predicted NAD/FAD-dependent oxidoreductase